MSTVFTKIIEGEIPGRFVWQDERCVGFLSIDPLSQGHTLVVPREEHDHWIDLPEDLAAHLMVVSQRIGKAIDAVWHPVRVGQMIQGFEVPHTHVHVWPADTVEQFQFVNVIRNPDPAWMDEAAKRIRAALAEAGHGSAVPQA
ncbi:HIT family protein [Kocuria arenosa]|uniref:HIT family protein n=1 Tax=Kocuria arenosa TaxID=3071446 RepID=UPI0034D52E59